MLKSDRSLRISQAAKFSFSTHTKKEIAFYHAEHMITSWGCLLHCVKNTMFSLTSARCSQHEVVWARDELIQIFCLMFPVDRYVFFQNDPTYLLTPFVLKMFCFPLQLNFSFSFLYFSSVDQSLTRQLYLCYRIFPFIVFYYSKKQTNIYLFLYFQIIQFSVLLSVLLLNLVFIIICISR